MNIYLMRHGIAVAAEDGLVHRDADRPLSDKGVKRLRQAARGMRSLKLPLDGILTSPLLRARQTADIVAAALGAQALVEEISGLAPESTVEHLMFGLTRYQNRAHLLLVGHQPLLGDTMAHLLGGGSKFRLHVELKKGSLCNIEIDQLPSPGPGTLCWFLTPKQLRLLGRKSAKH